MILNLEVSRAKVPPAYLLWSTRSEPQNTAVSTGVPQAAGPPHRISIVPRSRNGAIRSEILLLLEGRDGDAPRSAVLPNRKSGGHREIFQWRVKQDSSSTSTPHKAAPPPPVSNYCQFCRITELRRAPQLTFQPHRHFSKNPFAAPHPVMPP